MPRNQINGSGFIQGTALDDDIFGSLMGDNIRGADGRDIIYGDGRDQATGSSPASGGSPDRIYGEGGNDTIYGGNENENVDPLFATKDLLYGGDGSDSIYGEGGHDVLDGGSGGDWLDGGTGNDELYGGLDNDQLYGQQGNDQLHGDEGNDVLSGGIGNDIINGGSGTDVLSESADTNFTLTNTSLQGLGFDTLTSIEGASLSGGASDNTIDARGFSGFTSLYGNEGNDTIFGSSGNDQIVGGVGNDRIEGGSGFDTLIEVADVNFVLTNTSLLGLGTDILVSIEKATLFGGANSNTIDARNFSGSTNLYGLQGNDTLFGGSDNDWLYGGTDNDDLTGGAGNDTLFGDTGNDRLVGVNTNTSAPGRGEVDILTGGTESDRFVLGATGKVFYNDGYFRQIGAVEGFVRITDFSAGDVIELSGASTNYRLLSYSIGGITGTGIYSVQSTGLSFGFGSPTYNELIGVIQNQAVGSFSLTNNSQFAYV